MVSINENINKILLKNTYELSNIYVQIKIGRWLSHSLRRSFANIPPIKRISELLSKFESQAQRMITFILFVTHLLSLSVQKRMFRCTRVHKFIVWSIIFDKNWVCKKKNRQRSLCVWKWNLEIYNGEGERKKNTGGVVTLKRDLRSKNERDRWSSMILGHYKWESNGVAVHTMGKGIGRAKPQSGGNRGNSRVIFQRRIRHNRRRTICQNVNLCSLFWFNWKELIIMAHCSAFSLSFNHFHYLCYLFVIFSK